MERIDDAGAVRQGEGLDAARIEAFLKDTVTDLPKGLILRQFPGETPT